MELILKYLQDPLIAAAVSAVASIALAVLSRKGWNIPVLSDLLTKLIGRPPASPTDPSLPAPAPAKVDPLAGLPGLPGHPIANAVIAALLAQLAGKALAGFHVEEKDGAIVATVKTQG